MLQVKSAAAVRLAMHGFSARTVAAAASVAHRAAIHPSVAARSVATEDGAVWPWAKRAPVRATVAKEPCVWTVSARLPSRAEPTVSPVVPEMSARQAPFVREATASPAVGRTSRVAPTAHATRDWSVRKVLVVCHLRAAARDRCVAAVHAIRGWSARVAPVVVRWPAVRWGSRVARVRRVPARWCAPWALARCPLRVAGERGKCAAVEIPVQDCWFAREVPVSPVVQEEPHAPPLRTVAVTSNVVRRR